MHEINNAFNAHGAHAATPEHADCASCSSPDASDASSKSADAINSPEALQALLRVGNALARETDLDLLLRTICHETELALGADRCTVFVYDDEKKQLWSREGTGLSGPRTIQVPAGEGLAGWVLAQNKAVNIANAYEDERFNASFDRMTGYKTVSVLAMPLQDRARRAIGVFQVLNKLSPQGTPTSFTPLDLELLTAISASAGIALENALLLQAKRRTFESFIETLAATIDARDPLTSGHSWRVAGYARLLGEQLHLPSADMESLHFAALLHDIGKIGIREEVLTKAGMLTVQEYQHIQDHVSHTYNILRRIEFEPHLREIPRIAATHHERLDGSGYGEGLSGAEIPEGGLILAIADVFDALTSLRHYRDRMSFLDLMGYFRSKAGTHFAPAYVNALCQLPLQKLAQVMQLDAPYKDNYTQASVQGLIQTMPEGVTLGDLEQQFRRADAAAHEHPFLKLYLRQF
ncbi:MAG: HD domain-containing phosphohydrolase [Vampirovibrionales bacterium]|nr:HD domain-containing phosphohydrolase [Vampirovibrionales bacterium]